MIRGFQIWPSNSNRITFDPTSGRKNMLNQKGVKWCDKKGGQMLLDLNFDAIFEILII